MRVLPRAVAAGVLLVGVLAGCSEDPGSSGSPSAGSSGSPGSSDSSGSSGSATAAPELAAGTCWSDRRLGSDPQEVLAVATDHKVPYDVAATALADRPDFAEPVPCDQAHSVEVYALKRLPAYQAELQSYRPLLRSRSKLYESVAASARQACMSPAANKAVKQTGVAGAVMTPALAQGVRLSWAPAPPEQWEKGQRVFACTLVWDQPTTTRYAALETGQLPAGQRVCILTASRSYVGCGRKHDRERIASIDVSAAVAAGKFPGKSAVRSGSDGPYADLPGDLYDRLDAACTAYLRSVSTTKTLTGVANIDPALWPASDRTWPVWCEADTPPGQKSLVTKGSVFDRG